MVYCILSYDPDKVSLHCINSDLEKCRYLYKVLLQRFPKRLLELVFITDDYFSESGFRLFHGKYDTSQIKVIESTER